MTDYSGVDFLVRAAREFRRGGWVFTGFHWPVLAGHLAWRLPGEEFAQVFEAGAGSFGPLQRSGRGGAPLSLARICSRIPGEGTAFFRWQLPGAAPQRETPHNQKDEDDGGAQPDVLLIHRAIVTDKPLRPKRGGNSRLSCGANGRLSRCRQPNPLEPLRDHLGYPFAHTDAV